MPQPKKRNFRSFKKPLRYPIEFNLSEKRNDKKRRIKKLMKSARKKVGRKRMDSIPCDASTIALGVRHCCLCDHVFCSRSYQQQGRRTCSLFLAYSGGVDEGREVVLCPHAIFFVVQ